MNTLEINNLSKDYGDFRLKDISFSLPTGYIMGLIGPNGAGKTTIIKLIMNLIMKEGGNIKLFGKDHQQHEVEAKERIGFVYDMPNFYDHLNLKQLRSVIAPFYKNWDDDIFNDLVDRFELPMKKATKSFSKGMLMKSSIALALSHHADFIIMDEPTSGLDPVVRRELIEFFRDLIQDENKAILFSSHITSDIELVADYITYINKGKIVFSETKDDILERYALVKGGKDLLTEETKKSLVGIRINEFGFEALTDDVLQSKSIFGDVAIYDRVNLEDIMYFHNQNSIKRANSKGLSYA